MTVATKSLGRKVRQLLQNIDKKTNIKTTKPYDNTSPPKRSVPSIFVPLICVFDYERHLKIVL